MKSMKIILCVLLVFSLTFMLTNCLLGGNVKVDKDGNVIIKDKDNDGNDVVIGGKKWDKSKMHGLPAPKAKLETSIFSDDGAMYGFSEMKEKDAKNYIEDIKEAGFTYNSIVLDEYMYNGTNKDGLIINFAYDKESGSGSIMSGKGEPPSGEEDENFAVIGGSDKKWDSSLVGGLPDPGVEVASFWTVDGNTSYVLEAIPSYRNYVEKIKDCGFTEDINEVEIDSIFIFGASNSAGDRITFSVSDDSSTITFERAN